MGLWLLFFRSNGTGLNVLRLISPRKRVGGEILGVNFDAPALLILRIPLLQSWCHQRFHVVCLILGNEADELGEGTM